MFKKQEEKLETFWLRNLERDSSKNSFFKISLMFFLGVVFFSNLVSAFLISDQGTNVRETLTGSLLPLGNLTIKIYDSSSEGILVFNQTFTDAIVNGSWNLMINPELEYGKNYWKDYEINGESLDFDGNDRLEFQSSVGRISDAGFINFSLINSCPEGSSIREVYENGSVECTTTSAEEIDLTNYSLKNQSEIFEGNITTSQTGFFGWLGSLTSRISKLFVQDIDASGNVDITGNVTAEYFIGDGSKLTGLSEGVIYDDSWINSTFYNKNEITSFLSNYYNSSQVDNLLSNVNLQFGNFYNKSDIDSLFANIEQYDDSWINSTFYNKNEITSFLANYYNSSQVDNLLSNVNLQFGNFYNKSDIDNLFASIESYDDSWINSTFYNKAEIEGFLLNYYNSSEVDNLLSNVNNTDHLQGRNTSQLYDYFKGLYDSAYCKLTGCTINGSLTATNIIANNILYSNNLNNLDDTIRISGDSGIDLDPYTDGNVNIESNGNLNMGDTAYNYDGNTITIKGSDATINQNSPSDSGQNMFFSSVFGTASGQVTLGADGSITQMNTAITNSMFSISPLADATNYLGEATARWLTGYFVNVNASGTVTASHFISNGSLLTGLPATPKANTVTCSGTDKISAYNNATGTFTCSADSTGASGPIVLILASDVTTGTNTNLVDLTGMSFTANAGKTYEVRINGIVRSAATTTGQGFGVNCVQAPQIVALKGVQQLANTGTQTGWQAIANNAIAGVTSAVPTANTNIPSFGGGIIKAHATNTGTCTFRFRSETTAATIAKAGTTIIVTQLD